MLILLRWHYCFLSLGENISSSWKEFSQCLCNAKLCLEMYVGCPWGELLGAPCDEKWLAARLVIIKGDTRDPGTAKCQGIAVFFGFGQLLPLVCEGIYRHCLAAALSQRRMLSFTGLLWSWSIYWPRNFNLPFKLYTDTSTLGLGTILAQVQEGWEQIICCASHALSQTKKNYPATKLECLTTVWATAKLRPYLMSNKFNVYTNNALPD